MGGVDLSCTVHLGMYNHIRPRPCGRGGSKRGRGGFKPKILDQLTSGRRPRPCGRGGFKPKFMQASDSEKTSPPVWAGWI